MRLPLEYVSRELDKLYEKEFHESDIVGINQHCDFIQEFIVACGWTCEEIRETLAGIIPVSKDDIN